LVNCRY